MTPAPVGDGVIMFSHLAASDQDRYFLSQWSEHLSMQQAGQLTDLNLVAAGVAVPVHQAVLLPLSSILSSLVSGPDCCCPQSTPAVILTDTDLHTVCALVLLIYSGRCYISTGLEYSRLLCLLDMLGIDIQQKLTVHVVDSNWEFNLISQENISVNISNRVENRVDSEESYYHKKFRAGTPRGRDIQTNANYFYSPNTPDNIEFQDLNSTDQDQVPMEVQIEDDTGKEMLGQMNNKGQDPQQAGQEKREKIALRTEKTDTKTEMKEPKKYVKQNQGTNQPNDLSTYPVEEPKENVEEQAVQGSPDIEEDSGGDNELESSGEVFICRKCQREFPLDKPATYAIHERRCCAVPWANSEVVVSNNCEAKTSQMSEQHVPGLICPYCRKKEFSVHNYNGHVYNCYYRTTDPMWKIKLESETGESSINGDVWNVNSASQMLIANEISFEEEELDDSKNADAAELDKIKTPTKEEIKKRKRRGLKQAPCQLCDDVVLAPYLLKLHYVDKHFLREIAATLERSDLVCHLCLKEFSCRKTLIQHVGATHDKVQRFLDAKLAGTSVDLPPPRYEMEPKENNDDSYFEASDKLIIELQNVIDLDEEGNVNPHKPKQKDKPRILIKLEDKLQCHLCPNNFNSDYHLRTHYCSTHYSLQMEAEFGGMFLSTNGICPTCSKEAKSLKRFLLHMGAIHSEVVKYIPTKTQKTDESPSKVQTSAVSISNKPADSKIVMIKNWELNAKDKRHERHRTSEVKEQAESPPKTESKSPKLTECRSNKLYLCPITRRRDKNTIIPPAQIHVIKRHLALYHYYTELTEVVQQYNKKCPYCSKYIDNINLFLTHIAVTHNKVESFFSAPVAAFMASITRKGTTPIENERETKPSSESTSRKRQNSGEMGQMEHTSFKTKRISPDNNNTNVAKNIETQPMSQCHVDKCQKQFIDSNNLLAHYSLTHYRDVLSTRFAKAIKEKICSICNKSVKSVDHNKMLRHIGVWHRRVVSCLPTKISEELCDFSVKKPDTGLKQTDNDLEKSGKVKINQETDWQIPTENTLVKPKTKRIRRVLEDPQLCQVCGIQKPNMSTLLQHLCISHYHKQLRNEFRSLVVKTGDNAQCPKCDNVMKSSSIYVHLGCVHNEVLKYADWLVDENENSPSVQQIIPAGSSSVKVEVTRSPATAKNSNSNNNPNFSSPKSCPPTFSTPLSPVFSPPLVINDFSDTEALSPKSPEL